MYIKGKSIDREERGHPKPNRDQPQKPYLPNKPSHNKPPPRPVKKSK